MYVKSFTLNDCFHIHTQGKLLHAQFKSQFKFVCLNFPFQSHFSCIWTYIHKCSWLLFNKDYFCSWHNENKWISKESIVLPKWINRDEREWNTGNRNFTDTMAPSTLRCFNLETFGNFSLLPDWVLSVTTWTTCSKCQALLILSVTVSLPSFVQENKSLLFLFTIVAPDSWTICFLFYTDTRTVYVNGHVNGPYSCWGLRAKDVTPC